jgi:hypothetical protein
MLFFYGPQFLLQNNGVRRIILKLFSRFRAPGLCAIGSLYVLEKAADKMQEGFLRYALVCLDWREGGQEVGKL